MLSPSASSRAGIASSTVGASARTRATACCAAVSRSVRLIAERSRTFPVKAGGSTPDIRVTVSSTGNSLPSRRIAVSSSRVPRMVGDRVAR